MEREEIQLLIISFSIVLFTLLLTLFILFYFFQKKKSKFLIEKMTAELVFQSELTKSKIEIKEQTLTTVSKELHDNICQILSVALMQVNIILSDESKYTKANMLNLKDLINKSLGEIRMLSKLMNGDIVLESSFIEALNEDLERIKQLKTIKCSLNITGKVHDIDKEHETIIYRILQESISNILRHSHSETIDINIAFTDTNCNIIIRDTGKGFTLQNISKGNGFTNMETRAQLIGATFKIDSELEKGSQVTINYPIAIEEYA
ncbi:sensor histidine kinase [Flavobacterium beibuense]|uniref:histidine kinase n=1 Tax=Flavobacterium beibuense F44-8 TaxID=1406840 RepID=A0A0A2LRW9_9FLAO|nr:ATP-binding protein [Flavobacterium beibuense]KGO82659.1 histidine kinase [Flavobacterium beibuense F44-8]